MCPNCKTHSLCGCNSCKKRNRNKMFKTRTKSYVMHTFSNGNKESLIKCPYCRLATHPDAWMDEEYKLIKTKRNNK